MRVTLHHSSLSLITNVEMFENNLRANSGANGFTVYHASKFIQFLGAHWWRRQLKESATVIAVSPGLVVGTGLGRHLETKPNLDNIPDKLTIEEGTYSIDHESVHSLG